MSPSRQRRLNLLRDLERYSTVADATGPNRAAYRALKRTAKFNRRSAAIKPSLCGDKTALCGDKTVAPRQKTAADRTIGGRLKIIRKFPSA
jgi:hypothetical protein